MPKRSVPQTSKDAFHSLKHSEMQALYEKILWGLGQIEEGTFEEIAIAIKEPKARVWRRMSDLMKAGKVYRPGNKRPLESNREGYTWRLTQPGQSIEPVTEKAMPGKSVADYAKKIIQTSIF